MNSSEPLSNPSPASPQDPARWFLDEVHPHGAAVEAYLRRAYPAVQDAQDVVQESYLRIWKARALHPIACAKAFLFTIARRVALDSVRHARRSPISTVGDPASLDVLDDGPSVPEAVHRREMVNLLVAAVDALPARCREVVILHKFKLLPAREVAAQLGISEKGVEIQLKRGLDRVRAYLKARGATCLFDVEQEGRP